jgi:hypothetical protein
MFVCYNMISGYSLIANCHSLFFLTWYFSISLFSIRLAFDHWSFSELNKTLITKKFVALKTTISQPPIAYYIFWILLM